MPDVIGLVLTVIAAGLLARWLPTRRSRAFGRAPAGFPVRPHSVDPAYPHRAAAQRRSAIGAFASAAAADSRGGRRG